MISVRDPLPRLWFPPCPRKFKSPNPHTENNQTPDFMFQSPVFAGFFCCSAPCFPYLLPESSQGFFTVCPPCLPCFRLCSFRFYFPFWPPATRPCSPFGWAFSAPLVALARSFCFGTGPSLSSSVLFLAIFPQAVWLRRFPFVVPRWATFLPRISTSSGV